MPVLSTPVATELHHLQKAALADPLYSEQLEAVQAKPASHPDYTIKDKLLYFRGVVQVPGGDLGLQLRQQILWECHDCILSGHKGRDKTEELVRRRATWEGLGADVTDYVKSCPACQTAKKSNQKPVGCAHSTLPVLLPGLVDRPATCQGWQRLHPGGDRQVHQASHPDPHLQHGYGTKDSTEIHEARGETSWLAALLDQ
jgi:hypothetical protein